MAKKGRHRKGGRVTPPGTRPLSDRDRPCGRQDPEPDLLRNARKALADDHPLAVLALASSLLSVVDPRGENPFDRRPAEASVALTRDDLLGSFLDIDLPETSALLAAVAALGADQIERRRIHRVLDGRGHRLSDGIAGLGRAEAYRAVEMTHVLGDGDSVSIGVRLPSGHELTAVTYIDHNLGTLVKDGFVLDQPIDGLLAFMRTKTDDPDTRWTDIDLADARARITDAITLGAMTIPPCQTDTWPACRPLVEWVTGLLPEGGTGYERPEWSDQARRDLKARFLASPHATGLDDPDHTDLLDTIVWFACDYGPGDPLRWSPVAVEILLDDWIPRKIVADVAFLAKAPAVLRGFVTFCHAEQGIRAALTTETLHAIDQWEPAYQAAIRSSRPQGPAALLAAVGAFDPDGPWSWPGGERHDAPWGFEEMRQARLCASVGGQHALDTLDDEPLPDEPFAWTDIPDDIHDRVAEILALCDRWCDERLDTEYRTATRRLVAHIARQGPDALRRKGRTDTATAAVCWAIGKANDLFSPSGRGMAVKDLVGSFGLSPGSVSQRAITLLKAAGIDADSYNLVLGSTDYLVSTRRRRLIEQRNRGTS